jgi:large subunit ribosomal protein L21
MATAVIRTGGQQFRVSEGETVKVDRLTGEPGSKVEFSEVLQIGGDSPKIGKPLVSGAKVEGEIVAHTRGEKLVIFKFKRRKRHRRKNGHRQAYTAVRITSIQG